MEKIHTNYQKAGYTIIFAIRSKTEREKKARAEFYRYKISQLRGSKTRNSDDIIALEDYNKYVTFKNDEFFKSPSDSLQNGYTPGLDNNKDIETQHLTLSPDTITRISRKKVDLESGNNNLKSSQDSFNGQENSMTMNMKKKIYI